MCTESKATLNSNKARRVAQDAVLDDKGDPKMDGLLNWQPVEDIQQVLKASDVGQAYEDAMHQSYEPPSAERL